VALAAVCLLAAIVQGVFPVWLGVVVIIAVPVSMLIRPQTDMRGSVAVEASGAMQMQFLVVLNLTIAVWLAEVILRQVFLS
jgi:hypothetical protein